jgi:mono/diheme cytochrome c family protein
MLTRILKTGTIAFCAMMFVQCARPGSPPAKNAGGKDTASTNDSLSSTPNPAQPVSLTYEQQQGKILYTKYCAICHGDQGKGDGFNAYNLDPKPRDFTDPRAMAGIDDATMLATITEGGKGVNKSPLMPAWGGRMDKLEIQYVIEYVKALEKQH